MMPNPSPEPTAAVAVRAASRLRLSFWSLGIMKTRKKVIATTSITVLVVFWFYWCPTAKVLGAFSLRELASIRWQVRTHTLQPILRIYHNPDGTVDVYTGVQRADLDGCGNYYQFKKSQSGWRITDISGWQS